jgi:pimeloyl-ACP methyl ester carboxylesterase
MSIENQTKRPDFTEQFENKKSFELFGGSVEYVDIKPDVLKTEVPVLFALGWGESIETFRDSIRKIVSLGRRVICLNHTRSGGKVDDENTKNHPEEEVRKALAILRVLKENDIEKIDVIAHSEGGINVSIAGRLEPEHFRNIIFVNAGGLIGKDSFPELMFRFSSSVFKDYILNLFNKETIQTIFGSPKIDHHTRVMRTIKETAKYVAKNPLRALKESVAISQAQTTELLAEMHKSGIGISIVNGINDPVFPIERMKKAVNDLNSQHKTGELIEVAGGHSEIFMNPEESIPKLDRILDKMA